MYRYSDSNCIFTPTFSENVLFIFYSAKSSASINVLVFRMHKMIIITKNINCIGTEIVFILWHRFTCSRSQSMFHCHTLTRHMCVRYVLDDVDDDDDEDNKTKVDMYTQTQTEFHWNPEHCLMQIQFLK